MKRLLILIIIACSSMTAMSQSYKLVAHAEELCDFNTSPWECTDKITSSTIIILTKSTNTLAIYRNNISVKFEIVVAEKKVADGVNNFFITALTESHEECFFAITHREDTNFWMVTYLSPNEEVVIFYCTKS